MVVLENPFDQKTRYTGLKSKPYDQIKPGTYALITLKDSKEEYSVIKVEENKSNIANKVIGQTVNPDVVLYEVTGTGTGENKKEIYTKRVSDKFSVHTENLTLMKNQMPSSPKEGDKILITFDKGKDKVKNVQKVSTIK
ncbi:hypothetical protein [Domibacillus tundrae]|uniref:hypothetical protein n=1 Tax=Domibacillus tundrae TaxID=1587527 RepID=UPI0006182ED6|nr:hypothetical protein [Domibacillus tundrae]